MTQHFVPRSKTRTKTVSTYVNPTSSRKTKEDLLHQDKTSVFQSDDELEISNNMLHWKQRDFKADVEQHEKKFLLGPDKSPLKKNMVYKKKPVYKVFAVLTEEEKNSYCSKCENLKRVCHDVVIGPFCRDSFVRYFHEESKARADLLTAKKIFFNAYDNYCEIMDYQEKKILELPKIKVNPPGCVMEGSFGFCVDCFN